MLAADIRLLGISIGGIALAILLIARLGQVTLAQIAADFDQRYAALLATGAIEPLTGH